MEDILREHSRGFHIDWIIQQYQRLERRIRVDTIHGALLASRGVEGKQARMQERPLPLGVESTAVEIISAAGRIFALREVHRGEVAFGLVRFDTWTAELVAQQSGDG